MKPSKNYFLLQMKKTKKVYTAVMLVTALMLVGIFFVMSMLININTKGENKQRVKIGLVGDLSDTYLGMGFYAVENIDESRFSIEFEELELEKAKEKLNENKISAYVIVPDGFINSVRYGENLKLSFVMSESAAQIGPVLMSEVVMAVSTYVTESQKGIYAMMDYGYEY